MLQPRVFRETQYDSQEHESLRAAMRSTVVSYGDATRIVRLFAAMGVEKATELSPWGANYCRKVLQSQLPIRGDYA